MGLFLTLLFLALMYLSPAEQLPELAPYRPMLVLFVLTGLPSAFVLVANRVKLVSPLTLMIIGVLGSVVASRLARLWFGGALEALIGFSLVVGCYFFTVINTSTLARIRATVFVLTATAIFTISQGVAALTTGYGEGKYIYMQKIPDMESQARIRGVGILGDPNDLAQYIVCCLALLGTFWKAKQPIRNFLLIVVPSAYLIAGIYLTHSRGGVLGLAVVLYFFFRNRLSGFVSGLFTAMGLLALLAAGAVGERSMGMGEASARGRLEAWSDGLQMLKTSPVFGVGYKLFNDYHERVAHNAYVHCFAELGLIGYFFWLGMLYIAFAGLNRIGKMVVTSSEQTEYRTCGRSIFVSLAAFSATAWFLSRTYEPLLFVLIGLTAALFAIGRQRGFFEETPFRPATAGRIIGLQALSITVVYVLMRIRSL